MVQESTPRSRIRAAVDRLGEVEFARRCLRLLAGTEWDGALIEILGGASAPHVLAGGEGGPDGHWPKTWALRAFLYAWDPAAGTAVVAACGDDHWRVREMAAKVLAKRPVETVEAERALEALTHDDHERVAAAAARALHA